MTAPPAPRSQGRFRGDIEGMRAVAVLMVLLYHAGVPWAAGGFAGVDVFFVISGFLITGLLVAEARREARIDLVAFWARRARRLLPASALVLATTAVLTFLVLPAVRWRETGWDVLTSGLYVVNWRLAARSVDYLAEDAAPSPVQHYWSLAVEEQFYLLWPVLVVVALLLSRRRPARLGVALLVLLLAVVVPSFLWSLHLTRSDPALAYLVTTTRLWQLGVGAVLALAVTRLERLPGTLAALLAWAGLLAVLAGLLTQGPDLAWPGTAALVPTLGAAAMIAGGTATASPVWAATRILSWAPCRWSGRCPTRSTSGTGRSSSSPPPAGASCPSRPVCWWWLCPSCQPGWATVMSRNRSGGSRAWRVRRGGRWASGCSAPSSPWPRAGPWSRRWTGRCASPSRPTGRRRVPGP
ncbi:acyltransferase family protein [Ornithinimicrobium pratense]|uniref:Acyltransferase n=1 Tax=Ornithinimicrobium pratense TaxID=2593973 RepID=A0A5J6V337_9MICO|nr:acyltransferase [Ornithinimicrobium pratense]QFG68279.1 acyltransferase [Ornithinimicrobium pratense]